MNWTFEEIRHDWLTGGRLACPSEVLVAAFNRVDGILGHEWIEASRLYSGIITRGSAPTLRVVSLGQRLAAIESISCGVDRLIERIRRGDQSAEAELTAVYLLRSQCSTATVELFPKVGEREADFRVRRNDEPWTYVEVTQPNLSEPEKQARMVLERLTVLFSAIKKSFALEVFLRNEPNGQQLALLCERVAEFCRLEGVHREELTDGLGVLLLNHSSPGQVVLRDHPGETKRPRLCVAKAITGPDEFHRHIVVRMAFADERAEAFLRTEAKQLPKSVPGLIMVQMSRAPGGFKSWEPILRRRFKPSLHTRVCAVCLFSGGCVPTSEGEAWFPETKLVVNGHSKFALSSWIPDALRKAGEEFTRHVGV